MKLDDDDVRMTYHCVAAVVRGRDQRHHEVPRNLRSLYERLDAEFRSPTSVVGIHGDGGGEESTIEDPIDSATAAEILGCSTRWVRQIRTDLDGRWTGSQWVFDRQRVTDYAEGKADGRRAST